MTLLLTYPDDRVSIPTILSCSCEGDQNFDSRVADGDWRQRVLSIDHGPKRAGLRFERPHKFQAACLEYQRTHHRSAPNDYRRRAA